MELDLNSCTLRAWSDEDAESLAHHANNRKVWRNVRDLFPHPYTPKDAQSWIRTHLDSDPQLTFAIDVNGEAVGGIGLKPGEDVNTGTAEIGFWLGETHWGRGIATEAVAAVTAYALGPLGMRRVFAEVFEWNPGSMRVLEKCGYRREGVLRHAAIKDGEVIDQMLYAVVRERDPED